MVTCTSCSLWGAGGMRRVLSDNWLAATLMFLD